MNVENLVTAMEEIDEELIYNAVNDNPKINKFSWKKLIPLAACFCVLLAIVIPLSLGETRLFPPVAPEEPLSPECAGPPSFEYNGIIYMYSSHIQRETEPPEGFVYTGETTVGDDENFSPFYVNPDIPEWAYVYHTVYNSVTYYDPETKETYTYPPESYYFLYVDVRLRGKDLVNYNGEMYISLWSATYYGENPDITEEYYNFMENKYDIRIEGDLPEGFILAGTRIFTGYDTIPKESLGTNKYKKSEIYYNPNDPDVILVSATWHSANGEHRGFDTYIRYDCPLLEE